MDLHCIYLSQKRKKPPDLSGGFFNEILGALEGIRTPNLLIRSQMLYPLSYKRWSRCEYYPLMGHLQKSAEMASYRCGLRLFLAFFRSG